MPTIQDIADKLAEAMIWKVKRLDKNRWWVNDLEINQEMTTQELVEYLNKM